MAESAPNCVYTSHDRGLDMRVIPARIPTKEQKSKKEVFMNSVVEVARFSPMFLGNFIVVAPIKCFVERKGRVICLLYSFSLRGSPFLL
jgi:hypothetical protein